MKQKKSQERNDTQEITNDHHLCDSDTLGTGLGGLQMNGNSHQK